MPVAQTANLHDMGFVRLQDAWAPPAKYPIAAQIRADDLHRYQNILGDLGSATEDEAVALAVVDILGTASKSGACAVVHTTAAAQSLTPDITTADVVLSHSLTSYNPRLSTSILKRGVRLTFEHLKIVDRVSVCRPM